MLPAGAVIALGVLFLAGTVAIYRSIGSRLSSWQNAMLLVLRLAGVALVLLTLLQPSRLEEIPPPITHHVTLVAIDTSKSMAQRDVEQGTRLEAAQSIVLDAGLVTRERAPADSEVRIFEFGETASPLFNTEKLEAKGATTRFHHSVSDILATLRGNDLARALVVLSDGHDFELVNPAKTAFLARSRGTPIYAVPIGQQGKVRDMSVRITSYQPYCYVKQKARISAALRPIGLELESISVELLRAGKPVERRRVQVGEEPEINVAFDVVEPAVGQYEYEIRVPPLPGETDRDNNAALTYLNVIDQQMQVLFLEGAPYWDTTFLQRSLMRNDKMNVDSITQYAAGRARVIRKKAAERELKVPSTLEDWRRYDIVVLGRSVHELMGPAQLASLTAYVREGGGTVIFSRGPAFGGELKQNELEPVIWAPMPAEHVRLSLAREGQSLAPFRSLADQAGGLENVPDLLAGHGVLEKKPLAATLANVQGAEGSEPMPCMVHRRLGNGQVLSVGVDGLWRWAFNAKVEGANTIFDRFWDQMILWLMASRDFLPAQQFSLRASAANIPLGEKIYFRALLRDVQNVAGDIPLIIENGGQEVARTSLAIADPTAPDKFTAEFLPAKTGRYAAIAHFPDGTKQTVPFMAFDENLEPTEVATDVPFLRRLCEPSGGRVLKPEELGPMLKELQRNTAEATPTTRLVSLWDRAWVFWAIGLCFATDWFLRRRWGLC
jgi:hypothetical protein